MSQWHLIIDVALCENCCNCQLAAKDEYVGNEFPGYSAPHPAHGAGVIRIERTVRGTGSQVDAAYLPRMCNHCDDAPCVKAAPDAITQRPDGIVIIDAVKAKGRSDIVDACPYGAVIWNEQLQLPQNWIFDAHLLDQGWKEPRCQQVCPTGALSSMKTTEENIARLTRDQGLEVLKPELGTRPRILYRNLHRVTKHFLAGSVFERSKGIPDCVEGAQVRLLKDDIEIGTAITDAFGDFKFDRLDPESGRYRVWIHHTSLGTATAEVTLSTASVSLDPIELKPH
jgi:Fe-S-cluster-containing dehydrogenase component